jgi:hypothetical protein
VTPGPTPTPVPASDPGLDPAGQDADPGAGTGNVGDPAPGCDHDPNAHIGVHVADSQGAGVGGVAISVSSFSPGGATNDDGDLDLGDVPVGSYTVSGSKDGYAGGVASQTQDAPSGVTTLFNLTLDPAQAQLKVTVLDLDGNPVDAAAIALNDASVGVTDSTGNLDMGNHPPGSYTVTARKDNFQPDPATQTQTAPASTVTQFQLSLDTLKITSKTQAAFPSPKTRTRVGVGELVDLTCSTGSADWTMSPQSGNLSADSGATVTYTAPAGATSVTITAKDSSGATASITFTIVAPTGATWAKIGGSETHTHGKVDIQYQANIFIQPVDVSFEHISVRELQANAVGNGCYAALIANATAAGNPVQHQHAGEGQTLMSVQGPTSDSSGSKVSQPDTVGANVDNDKVCNGGWTTTIPLVYAMGPSTPAQFTTVDQIVTVTPPGTITVSKGGSSGSGSSSN